MLAQAPPRPAGLPSLGVALLIASDLHKDVAGRPLLRGVSFKLERRERMTLAGRNGAGKTTLLRMLAGEASIDRGELSLAKGARVALHDQDRKSTCLNSSHQIISYAVFCLKK